MAAGAAIRETLSWFPYTKTVHRTVFVNLPLTDKRERGNGGFRSLRRATKGLCPLEPRKPLKRLERNFFGLRGGGLCETFLACEGEACAKHQKKPPLKGEVARQRRRGYAPVDPNPPPPRAVSPRLSLSSSSALTTGTKHICAILSPAPTHCSLHMLLCIATMISPR